MINLLMDVKTGKLFWNPMMEKNTFDGLAAVNGFQ